MSRDALSPLEVARALLADALQVDLALVDERTALGGSPQWDSLAHTRLILAVEERLGRPITPPEVLRLTSLVELGELLGSKP
jgi:acyl carrier protein